MKHGDTVFFIYNGEIKEATIKSFNKDNFCIVYDTELVNNFVPKQIYYTRRGAEQDLNN